MRCRPSARVGAGAGREPRAVEGPAAVAAEARLAPRLPLDRGGEGLAAVLAVRGDRLQFPLGLVATRFAAIELVAVALERRAATEAVPGEGLRASASAHVIL